MIDPVVKAVMGEHERLPAPSGATCKCGQKFHSVRAYSDHIGQMLAEGWSAERVRVGHQHGNWDAGGHCNNLVVDENGDADSCSYVLPEGNTEYTLQFGDGSILTREFDSFAEAYKLQQELLPKWPGTKLLFRKIVVTEWFDMEDR